MNEINLINYGLTTDILGQKCYLFDEIDSTNLYLIKNASKFENGTTIIAKYQTTGKGRLNRDWTGEKDKALMFSFLLKEYNGEKLKSKLAFVAAIGIKLAISKLYNTTPSIKWPNDIYLEDRKIAGVLCQNTNNNIIVGIGINVNQENFNEDLKAKASSLLLITGKYIDLFIVLSNVLNYIEKTLKTLEKEGFSILRLEILKNFQFHGNIVKVISGDQIITGKLDGIDNEGALILEVKGKKQKIYSGDVSLCLWQ